MDKIIEKISADILKDQIQEDVQKKFDAFRKTKEYQTILKSEIKKEIIHYCSDQHYDIDNELAALIKQLVSQPPIKNIIQKQLLSMIKSDPESHVENILRGREIWDDLADYLEGVIGKALEYATSQIEKLMDKK